MTPSRPAILLWGEDAYLLREAARERLAGFEITEVDAGAWQGGEVQDLATPPLFGEPRRSWVTDARSAAQRRHGASLPAYLSAPGPRRASSGQSACTVGRAREAAGRAAEDAGEPVGEVRQVKLTRKDPGAVDRGSARRRGSDVEPTPVARALIEMLGKDRASSEAAVLQLGTAFAGTHRPRELVERQFRGLGEQKMWDLCDRAFGK